MLWVACKTSHRELFKNKTLPLYLPTNEHSVTSKFRKRTVERPKNSQITNMFTDSLFGEGQTTDNFTVRTGARAVLLAAQLTILFKS